MTNPKCGQNICSVNMGNLTAGIKSHSPDAKTRWRFKVLLFKLAVLAGKKNRLSVLCSFFCLFFFFVLLRQFVVPALPIMFDIRTNLIFFSRSLCTLRV